MTEPPVPKGQLPALPRDVEVTAWKVDLPIDVRAMSPRMAMILMTHVTWMRWAEYAFLLEQQMLDPVSRVIQGQEASESAGLVGHKWAMDPKSSQLYATGEEVRALAALEGEERDRLMRYAKQCHDAGLLGDEW